MKKLIAAFIAITSCVFADYYHMPVDCHQAISTAVNGSSIFIEDGSEWTIHMEDRGILSCWNQQDILNISLNNSFFPASQFYITNPRTGEYVRADMKLGPRLDSLYRKRIVGIDHYYGEICIEDGSGYQTWWTIDSADRELLSRWNVNNTVIIGSNNSWYAGFFSSCDNTLYVVEHNVAVRAREH